MKMTGTVLLAAGLVVGGQGIVRADGPTDALKVDVACELTLFIVRAPGWVRAGEKARDLSRAELHAGDPSGS